MLIRMDNSCEEIKIQGNSAEELQGLLGGRVKIIRNIIPEKNGLAMIVNTVGIIKGLQSNRVATFLHSNVIAGDAIFVNVGREDGRIRLMGLDESDIKILYSIRDTAIRATKILLGGLLTVQNNT